ncbi:hypothetical protein CRM22_000228 [Opisthorchis felineus]|uniref:Uncharacterized protein n=1 Tax=Opisthorchis felineus TaxID=147828 RepID=A0A4S2MGA1_OPIFE|nr:hypothetical protein CRM22_000228 [Opisthorchis felineus]
MVHCERHVVSGPLLSSFGIILPLLFGSILSSVGWLVPNNFQLDKNLTAVENEHKAYQYERMELALTLLMLSGSVLLFFGAAGVFVLFVQNCMWLCCRRKKTFEPNEHFQVIGPARNYGTQSTAP